MKKLILLIISLVVVNAEYPNWFYSYIKSHHKKYNKNEMKLVYSILAPKFKTLTKIKDITLKLHHFSDKKISRNRILRTKEKDITMNKHTKHHLGSPQKFDWRKKGYVTSVIEQGDCGGCFSIAAMGSLEYWYKKKTGNLLKLSAQQGIDCTRPMTDGCDGGLMEDVYKYAMYHSIGPESFDPFLKHDSQCKAWHKKPSIKVEAFMVQTEEYHVDIERKLAHNLLSYGPIPIGIDSNSHAFELYSSGVMKKHHCGKDIDHAVLVVGYTEDYWIIKNSWGTDWGENGYFRLERGKNACGINTYASFVTSVKV
ncbi:MAG: hypothetical protein CMF41_01110 [Legionellales bacterium]|nr:hypothetical protein [Legionellales bacterium]